MVARSLKPLGLVLVTAVMQNRVRTLIPRYAISRCMFVENGPVFRRPNKSQPTTKRPALWLSSSLSRLNSDEDPGGSSLGVEVGGVGPGGLSGCLPLDEWRST